MKIQSWDYLKKLFTAATGPQITEWKSQLLIVLTTTFIHITASVELGYKSLEVRIPLALFSVIPVLLLIQIAATLSKFFSQYRVRIVLGSFFLGGLLRGWILDESLRKANILQQNISSYRVFAGSLIVLITCVSVNALRSNIQNVQSEIYRFHKEAKSLEEALAELASVHSFSDTAIDLEVSNFIKSQIIETNRLPGDLKSNKLNEIIEQIVRPISRELAKEIQNWSPKEIPNPKIDFKTMWSNLKPIENLPIIWLGLIFLPLAPLASSLAVFGVKNSIVLSLVIVVGLAFSLPITYWFIKEFITELNSPFKFLLMHLSFIFITLPPTLLTTFVLRKTTNASAYLVSGFIVIPVFYWLIIGANAAWDRTREIQADLRNTRNQLIWSIARINLLNWYHKGVLFRLIHGSIQNILFVGMTKFRISNTNYPTISIEDLTAQIDKEVKAAFNAEVSVGHEKELLQEIALTWEGIAKIEIDFDGEFQQVMGQDPAAAHILIDLVREVCSNSIRHGGADSIRISGKCDEGNFYVDIHENGQNLGRGGESDGLGLAFLESCCVAIEHSSNQSGNTLSMAIPVIYKRHTAMNYS